MISQSELKELIDYDPDTGIFTWKACRGGVNIGDIAGHECLKNGKMYRLIGLNGRLYRAHRLAFMHRLGEWPPAEVDHINGDGTDNHWDNLRMVDRQENCRNMRLHSHNTSGMSGVSWRTQRNRWRAYITVGNQQRNLGHFDTLLDAACARKSAEVKLGFHSNHGEVRPL